MNLPPFLRRTSRGVTIDLRVQPRARKTMLQLSNTTLKVSVAAPPVEGAVTVLKNFTRL